MRVAVTKPLVEHRLVVDPVLVLSDGNEEQRERADLIVSQFVDRLRKDVARFELKHEREALSPAGRFPAISSQFGQRCGSDLITVADLK